MRYIHQRGLELVKHFESLFLKAYKDPVGIWTIGWGHTGLRHNDGTVYKGREITEEDAHQLLRHDMESFSERVESLVKVVLTDDQFDALTSFDFNTGALHKSTLLKKLNKGDYDGAAGEFEKWNKAGGKVLRGLTRRRKSEKNLFLSKEDFIVPA
jgi:lysozyme